MVEAGEWSSCGDGGLVKEQGTPFAGGLPVFRGAAARFVMAVELAQQFRLAPTGNEFAALAVGEFKNVHCVHAGSVACVSLT